MLILSMNFNHDGAAVLLGDGRIVGWVTTERGSRVKKHPGVRTKDLIDLLGQAGATLGDVDHVVIVNLGTNYPEVVERYGTDFKDTWVPMTFDPSTRRVTLLGRSIACTPGLDHFLCHAATPYYFSPYEEAVSFACDPLGSGAYLGRGGTLTPIDTPSTQIGSVYSHVSHALLGFGGLYGAGKTMGLAPYGAHGDPELSARLAAACQRIQGPCDVSALVREIDALANERPVWVEEDCGRWNATIAFLVQEALEVVWVRALSSVHAQMLAAGQLGASGTLCLSGGTALNSVANQRCFERSGFERLALHPACGDDGTALGGALHHFHHVLGRPRVDHSRRESMYAVRDYGRDSVDAALAVAEDRLLVERTERWIQRAAELIAEGKILGWFRGAGEIGPRALGNRSILCDPRVADMKERLNARVKFREAFRPFAPSVLEEAAKEWFDLDDSPYMLRVSKVRKSGLPAVTHFDGTARIQSVRREDNPDYYALIEAFRDRTGVPLVVNTSFNTKAEPIVETPEHAVQTFLQCGLDALVFPGVVVRKREAAAPQVEQTR